MRIENFPIHYLRVDRTLIEGRDITVTFENGNSLRGTVVAVSEPTPAFVIIEVAYFAKLSDTGIWVVDEEAPCTIKAPSSLRTVTKGDDTYVFANSGRWEARVHEPNDNLTVMEFSMT